MNFSTPPWDLFVNFPSSPATTNVRYYSPFDSFTLNTYNTHGPGGSNYIYRHYRYVVMENNHKTSRIDYLLFTL